MPTQADETLYKDAVQWIHEHPEDARRSEEIKRNFLGFNGLSPVQKSELITTLHAALKTTGLPEKIQQSLPYLTFDLGKLPEHMLLVVKDHLLNESDIRILGSASKRMHALFQLPKRLLDTFLQRVAYGEQDKVELLFTAVYRDNARKRQEALLHQGTFTDYSRRTFNCSAYEYAYWAKDTHMCRMLERYMDDATKAIMAARIDDMEKIDTATSQPVGLVYHQNGVEHRSAHFDLKLLKDALQAYASGYEAWYNASNWASMEAAWMVVGKAQRDVPAHVVQEYCRPDRPFHPCPPFNEPTLPRVLTFCNWTTSQNESWFPLASSNSGLGLIRMRPDVVDGLGTAVPCSASALRDLAALTRLDEVRTADLTLSREHLNPPAVFHGMIR